MPNTRLAATTGELTPLRGTPAFAPPVRQARRAIKPLSLQTGQVAKRVLKESEDDALRRPINLRVASAVFGAAVALLWGLAALAFPAAVMSKSLAVLLLLAGIAAAGYTALALMHRDSEDAAETDWPTTLLEAALPSVVLFAASAVGPAPALTTLVAISATALLVCMTRLSPNAVIVSSIVSAVALTATTVLLSASPPAALAGPIALLLFLGAICAFASHYLATIVIRLTGHEEHTARIEKELGRYVSHKVARAIISGDEAPGKPERRDVTVVFCDLRGFTFLCERELPEDVVELLNTVYEGVCGIIQAYGGSVNKFLGDGLLAIFGAPDDHPNHAAAAAKAATEIQQLIHFLRDRGGIWTHLALGIGIDTGAVVAGPIGGTNRLEYTVIGSSVNRAARLQGFAESDRQRIVLSEATRRALPEGMEVRSLGPVELKGFSRAEEIFTLQ